MVKDRNEIIKIAMEQSAIDFNCNSVDFCKSENVVVDYEKKRESKSFYDESFLGNIISYGKNIVASVKPECKSIVKEYISKFKCYHCFETPNLYWLNEGLYSFGQKACFMSEYFLPDFTKLKKLDCEYKIEILNKSDFENLYLPQWSNALCKERKDCDVLGIGAYDLIDGKKTLVGFAGASADCENMWQIGVDVLPEYRSKGIGASVTSNLALAILEREKIPFYCCAWSNLPSCKNALKSGFTPAWIELSIKSISEVEKNNQN